MIGERSSVSNAERVPTFRRQPEVLAHSGVWLVRISESDNSSIRCQCVCLGGSALRCTRMPRVVVTRPCVGPCVGHHGEGFCACVSSQVDAGAGLPAPLPSSTASPLRRRMAARRADLRRGRGAAQGWRDSAGRLRHGRTRSIEYGRGERVVQQSTRQGRRERGRRQT